MQLSKAIRMLTGYLAARTHGRVTQACLEDLETGPRRVLDRSVVRQLATCRWVGEHHNVLITGVTSVGKTYLACALAPQACRQGDRVIYCRLLRLFDD